MLVRKRPQGTFRGQEPLNPSEAMCNLLGEQIPSLGFYTKENTSSV